MSKESDDLQPRLPTRVSNACQRCRRNKSRCDSYRPCSLCRRANADCISSSVTIRDDEPDRPRKRPRQYTNVEPLCISSTDRPSFDGEQSTGSLPGIRAASQTPGVSDSTSSHRTQEDHGASQPQEISQPSPVIDRGEAESAIGLTRRIFLLGKGSTLTRSTSAIPDGSIDIETSLEAKVEQKQIIASILGCDLPSTAVMESLLEEYFSSVHWFSLIIYEPKFRKQWQSVLDGYAHESQKTFLILLATVLGVAAWYRSQKLRTNATYPEAAWDTWKTKLLNHTESKVFELMDQTSLAAVQTFILLGSYHVYHGKPNSAFTLLGATIKAAQALGLHREWTRGDFDDIEERKRVWWTIYTWDRFASITYGRPLGINDQDCSVTMPSDIFESPYFRKRHGKHNNSGSVCFSTYQRQLNNLYLIASPLIEIIFGLRRPGTMEHVLGNAPSTSLKHTVTRLHQWKQQLPSELALDLDEDASAAGSLEMKVLRLQALALQLTFDSIIIILYRSLLIKKVDNLSGQSPGQANDQIDRLLDQRYDLQSGSPIGPSALPISPGAPIPEQWWNAAVRTSRITALPQLAQLATDSHLVAFLAINLFNAAVVMVVCALSDPLSDKSQEAKRYITRVYRLLNVLGRRSTLPRQSSIILKDVIRLLLQHEEDAMLATVMIHDESATTTGVDEISRRSSLWRDDLISVEDALRLPLNASIETGAWPSTDYYPYTSSNTRDEATRLNDSLASVQKMFPTHRVDTSELNSGQQLRTTPMSEGNAGLMSFSQAANATGSTNYDLDGPSNSENGMFWIWDSIDPMSAWR